MEQKQQSEQQLEKEMKTVMEQKDLLQYSWKINYQTYISDYYSGSSEYNALMHNGVKLFKLLSEFRINATQQVEKMIKELCLPPNLRTFNPVSIISNPDGLHPDVPSKLFYQSENYLVTVCAPEEINLHYLREKGFESFVVEDNSVDLVH